MNINQLLFLTFILLFYIQYLTSETYESFEGEVTPGSCIQRMLDYECIDLEKRDQFNIDCENFEIAIPSGIVNIHCDNKVLFDTLLCEKMITEGACECIYGRRQVQGLCNVPPLNISCPMELQSRDLAIINKMNTLNEETNQCRIVQRDIEEGDSITKCIQRAMKNKEGGYIGFIIVIVLILTILSFTFLYKKK